MARLSLERICSSSKAKIIETNNGSFVLGHLQPSKYKIYDSSKDQDLDGIYASEDFTVKNNLMNPLINDSIDTDIDVRGPVGEYISLVQGKNFAIGIKAETLNGIANYNSLCSYYEIEPELIPIYQRPTSGYTQEYYNNLSAPRVYLSGLPYAYISEMPLDSISYDFDDGILYGDSLSLKNPYDYKYDLDINDESIDTYLVTYLSGSLISGQSSGGDRFGNGLSYYNNRIAIGAPYENRGSTFAGLSGGVVYIFDKSNNSWNETTILSSSIPTSATLNGNNLFGYDLSLSGDRLVIGTPWTGRFSSNGYNGTAHIYEYSSNVWTETNILCGDYYSNPTGMTSYGFSTDLYNNRIAIGAPLDSLGYALTGIGPYYSPGSTYIYDLSGTDWILTQKLTGDINEIARAAVYGSSRFGYDISLQDDRIVIGAPINVSGCGSVYVYDLSGSTWTNTQILTGSVGLLNPLTQDNFGYSVSLDNNRIAVGSPYSTISSVSSTQHGLVYIYDLSGSTWVESQILTASYYNNNSFSTGDRFGTSVSLKGNKLLVGAPYEDIMGHQYDSGLAYLFCLSGDTWIESQRFLPSIEPSNTDDEFGKMCTFNQSGDSIAIASYLETSNSIIDAGVVYIADSIANINDIAIDIDYSRTYNKIGIDKNDAWISYNPNRLLQSEFHQTSAQIELIVPIDSYVTKFDTFSKYEQIERIKGFSRLDSNDTKHKSNLFSIRIKNTNLNEAIEDETLRENIQTSIEKSIRDVIKKITPANTQLWKIEWRGD